jgi:outer membrane protein assembly factor BamA
VFNRCDSRDREAIEANLPFAVASASLARVRTDNPVGPTRGTSLRMELRSSSRLIGSARDLQFSKGTIDGAWYLPFAGGTLATRLRFGAVIGTKLSFNRNVQFFVPPQERLYAGGATSVRGFQQNELGSLVYIAQDAPDTVAIPDTVLGEIMLVVDSERQRVLRRVPVGGNSLVVGNIDYRFRTPFLPDLLQFSVFTDAGEVWNRGYTSERFGFRRLRWTPGVGIRVFSPVGPIQVNAAYNPYGYPLGPIYFDAPPVGQSGGGVSAPLYCVSPNNRLPMLRDEDGRLTGVQAQGSCPPNFAPTRQNNFFSRLTFTFSIGPDF